MPIEINQMTKLEFDTFLRVFDINGINELFAIVMF